MRDFDDFVTGRSGSLLRFAYLLTGDRHLAEDLTQEALVRAHRRWHAITGQDGPEPYVRQVILRHALPNALLPTITIVAMNIGWLMGSLVVVETVFSYPGLGRTMVFAVSNRDVPMLQMTVLVTAGVYCLANLIADVLYAYLNPRVRY